MSSILISSFNIFFSSSYLLNDRQSSHEQLTKNNDKIAKSSPFLNFFAFLERQRAKRGKMWENCRKIRNVQVQTVSRRKFIFFAHSSLWFPQSRLNLNFREIVDRRKKVKRFSWKYLLREVRKDRKKIFFIFMWKTENCETLKANYSHSRKHATRNWFFFCYNFVNINKNLGSLHCKHEWRIFTKLTHYDDWSELNRQVGISDWRTLFSDQTQMCRDSLVGGGAIWKFESFLCTLSSVQNYRRVRHLAGVEICWMSQSVLNWKTADFELDIEL